MYISYNDNSNSTKKTLLKSASYLMTILTKITFTSKKSFVSNKCRNYNNNVILDFFTAKPGINVRGEKARNKIHV